MREFALWTKLLEEGRGTRNGYEASKGLSGDIGPLIEALRGKFRGSKGSRKTPEALSRTNSNHCLETTVYRSLGMMLSQARHSHARCWQSRSSALFSSPLWSTSALSKTFPRALEW